MTRVSTSGGRTYTCRGTNGRDLPLPLSPHGASTHVKGSHVSVELCLPVPRECCKDTVVSKGGAKLEGCQRRGVSEEGCVTYITSHSQPTPTSHFQPHPPGCPARRPEGRLQHPPETRRLWRMIQHFGQPTAQPQPCPICMTSHDIT